MGVADGDGGDGDTGGHLEDAVEGIDSAEGFGLDGDADDGKRGEAGDHTGEMGGTAGGGDDDFESASSSGFGVLKHGVGGAVGADDFDFVGDAEGFEGFGGGKDRFEVAFTAHDDADNRVHGYRLLGLGRFFGDEGGVAFAGPDVSPHQLGGLLAHFGPGFGFVE